MLRLPRTTTAFRLRLAPALLADGLHPGGRRSPRPMAVPMALALERSSPPRASQLVAVGLLALTLASLWRQDSVVSITRGALDSLPDHRALAANAVALPDSLVPGQVNVVAGGSVPMPTSLTEPNAASADRAALEAITPVAPTAVPTPEAAPEPVARSREERLPLPPGAARWQREFILSIAPGARESQRKSGVPASVTLAQAILESDWGRSKLTREANNLFGIKAMRGPGTAGIYEIDTWEVYDGQNVTVLAAFKAYTTLADSIADHGRWFHDNSRYRGALLVKDHPRAFAYAINAAGYATDPAYAPKLIGLMDKFNLYAYDVRPDE